MNVSPFEETIASESSVFACNLCIALPRDHRREGGKLENEMCVRTCLTQWSLGGWDLCPLFP